MAAVKSYLVSFGPLLSFCHSTLEQSWLGIKLVRACGSSAPINQVKCANMRVCFWVIIFHHSKHLISKGCCSRKVTGAFDIDRAAYCEQITLFNGCKRFRIAEDIQCLQKWTQRKQSFLEGVSPKGIRVETF